MARNKKTERHGSTAAGPVMQAKVAGAGKPLVLVPGGLTGWASWEPHARLLSDSRRVVRVQLLNVQYGLENRDLPTGYSVNMESRALCAALDNLGLDAPADVVAWSYGALITLDWALDHVDRVRTLALIEPPAFWVLHALDAMDEETRQIEAILRTFHGDISEEQLARFLCLAGLCPPGKSARELPQWPGWVPYRNSLRNNPAILDHRDDPLRLHALRRPVLLVRGTGSSGYYHRMIALLAAELPEARVTEMPAGHAPHIVSRDRFLQELSRFQDSAPPGGAPA